MSDMERSGPDDVEGHAYRQEAEATDEDQVADDVEGHGYRQDAEATREDDVEGHALRSQDQS
jgi:hypothetical protein